MSDDARPDTATYRVVCRTCGHDLSGVPKGYVEKFMERHEDRWEHDAEYQEIQTDVC